MDYTSASSKMVSATVRANSHGTTESVSRESGKTARRTDLEFGNRLREITTKANGSKTSKTGRVTSFIRTIRPIAVISESF